MKRRLFWKILLGVWAMLIVITLGSWLLSYYYFVSNKNTILGTAQNEGVRFAQQMALVLSYGGKEGLDRFMSTFPDEARRGLTLRRATAEE